MSEAAQSPSDSLRQRFLRTFGSLDAQALVARSRAIIGTDQLPNTPQGRLALSGLTKMRTGAEPGPTPAEYAALEYMIRALRPVPLVHNDAIDPVTDPEFLHAFPHWPGFLAAFPAVAQSIGRISRTTGATLSGEGTGFLVAPRVLLTNTHVLDALSHGVRALERGQAAVEFRVQEGLFEAEPVYAILRVLAVHETEDACLLEVEDTATRAVLSFATAGAETFAEVAAVGFPYPDPSRDPAFVQSLFQQKFGFKRVAPGLVTGVQARTHTIYHDCSTLGGNSGSPLLSLKDCTVVGLHRGGGFLWKNLAIDSTDLAVWVGDHAHA